MKILICSTRMGVGGAETHVLSLAETLTGMGHSVTVLSSGGVYADKLARMGLDHRKLPLDKKDPVSVLTARRAIKKIAVDEGFDIVHVHGRIPAFICRTLRGSGKFPPVVVTAHGILGPSATKKSFSYWGDRTVAVSGDVKRFLTETYGVPEDRISVIPNGVRTDLPAHVPAKNLRIVTASRLDGDTALTALLLCEMMPRIRRDFKEFAPTLTVAGGGNMLSALRSAARRINASDPGAVTVAGEVTDMPSLIARADIFVGSSRAALEAMAAGVPTVLCSDVGCAGVPDETNIRRCEETNFTCRGEEETSETSLRVAMERLLCASERERSALARFGRAYVLTRSSAEFMAKKTLETYRSLIDEKRPGIMLCGYFGCRNAGDTAALGAVLGALRRTGVTPVIPAKKKAILPDSVRRIGRLSLAGLSRELKSARIFVLCGGTLIQNSTSTRSLIYYDLLCRMADRNGAKIVLFGGGIGPVTKNIGEYLAGDILRRARHISLRDPESASFAEEVCGISAEKLNVTADTALNTPNLPFGEGRAELKKMRYFAVSARSVRELKEYTATDEKIIHDALCDAVTKITEKYGLVPLWVPFAPEDVTVIKRLSRTVARGKVLPLVNPGEIVHAMSSCVFSVGMRMHMAVFSSCAGIPAVCLSYDPKVNAFAEYAGHPDAVPALSVGVSPEEMAEKLVSAADEVLADLGTYRERIAVRTAELRRAARDDLTDLVRIYEMEI